MFVRLRVLERQVLKTKEKFWAYCRLLPANLLHPFSKRAVGGECYSFSVGFLFQEEGAPLPAKILGGLAVRKCDKGIVAHWRSALVHYVPVTPQDINRQ